MLIVPDASTRLAALRTGKVDALGFSPLIAAEDFKPLSAANPELLYKGMLSRSPGTIYFKLDTELFDDINVRRALHMAVNFQEIKDEYYGGEAVYPTFSLAPFKGVEDAYTPLDEMPEELRELWEYNPEKAKQLLDAAGYPGPDRFTTELLLWSPEQIDLASLLAFYWGEIGVTLKLDVRTNAVYRTVSRARTFTGLVTAAHSRFAAPYKWVEIKYPSTSNLAGWEDDYYMELHTKLWSFDALGKPDLRNEIAKEMNLYVLKDVVGVGMPFPLAYRVWWPWLKNYNGEYGVGYMDRWNFATFMWIDQELKKSMGY
jgi:peptide/nickel transport system substrate-binding protein